MFGITPIVLTSPIRSHPSTEIIEATLKSIQHHMPTERIMVMCDGIRPEQESMQAAYDEYISRLVQHELPFTLSTADYFIHQIGLMREALKKVKTELILFCEHDTPLVTDEPIYWYDCCRAIDMGEVNLIRFLHEAHIHPEHKHLMHGQIDNGGVTLTKTTQFSARPHLASVEFYKRLLKRFTPDAKCFIEDFAHSVCQTDPWEEWKLSIYTPFGNMKRSLHSDGRAGGPKWDDTQVF